MGVILSIADTSLSVLLYIFYYVIKPLFFQSSNSHVKPYRHDPFPLAIPMMPGISYKFYQQKTFPLNKITWISYYNNQREMGFLPCTVSITQVGCPFLFYALLYNTNTFSPCLTISEMSFCIFLLNNSHL